VAKNKIFTTLSHIIAHHKTYLHIRRHRKILQLFTTLVAGLH